MRGQTSSNKFLDFGREFLGWFVVRLQNYPSLDRLSCRHVGNTDDSCHRNGAVARDALFDFPRTDAVARALDDVVSPAQMPEIALFILGGKVPGEEEIASNFGLG